MDFEKERKWDDESVYMACRVLLYCWMTYGQTAGGRSDAIYMRHRSPDTHTYTQYGPSPGTLERYVFHSVYIRNGVKLFTLRTRTWERV